ncbi:MAG: metallophosphoesterase [Defluviitaleaceae bacterium]|nr:metallophosphoesterase [Defluviitaleaceae bacterium]
MKKIWMKGPKWIRIGVCIILAIGFIHILHAITLDRIIQYKEITFYSETWPIELDGYRIVFVSDTHEISYRRLSRVVDNINAWQPDILLLGGDIMALQDGRGGTQHYRQTLGLLARVDAVDGIFGVTGNHDVTRWLFDFMEELEMTPLLNEGLHIHPGFFLAGVDDYWAGRPCFETATYGASEGDFVLAISHNPDAVMSGDTSNVDLVLSGHTHGGQITFFGLWAPYFTFDNFTTHGQRFLSGWSYGDDGTPVFVSNGVGEYLPRIFARPQVIFLTMRSE